MTSLFFIIHNKTCIRKLNNDITKTVGNKSLYLKALMK